MGIFFLEFGLRYKKNLSKLQKYRQNLLVFHNKIQNLQKGLRNRARMGYFQTDYTKLHPSYINEKVAAKGLEWCYIGENWRKLAEIG